MIKRPIPVDDLVFNAKLGRRYNGVSWEDTKTIASYIALLEDEIKLLSRSNGVANNVINPTASVEACGLSQC